MRRPGWSSARWGRAAAAAAALCLALTGASDGFSDAADAADAGTPPDAAAPGAGSPDAGRPGKCAHLEERIERRKAWLAARRLEQYARGGPSDPARGVLDAVGLWCEEHPDDEECALGSLVAFVDPDDLVEQPDWTPEDRDLHVIQFKRDLEECRQKERRRGR